MLLLPAMADADDVSSAGLGEPQDHGGGSGGGSHGVGSRTGEDAEEWLQNVLRALADTQRQLAGGKVHGGGRRNLSEISIEDFHGGSAVTTHQYRMFKKHVLAVQKLHGLTDSELAFLGNQANWKHSLLEGELRRSFRRS